MTEYERIREKIACFIRNSCSFLESLDWADLDEEDKEMFRKEADQLLSLDGIEIRAKDQSLPENPVENTYPVDKLTESLRARARGYNQGQQDMLKAGFVKVIPKER